MEQGLGYFLVHLIDQLKTWYGAQPAGEMAWLIFGLAGQTLFMMRFIVQWIHSERHQKSVIPDSFWYLSLLGGLSVLAYGFHRVDPVIILGQLPGTIVYSRNLILIRRERRRGRSA
jgi:lipid-A-disaccharide synthase-like uncharacterized protein